MIKNIIKRDGSIEPFSPSKINGWGEWAAKTLNGYVNWGSVVIDTVNACQESCSSLDLQKKLIDVCLSRKTWEYNKMAGRLYASLIEREIYPSGRPTIKQVHENLQRDGLMVWLDYSDEEYAELESVIDHKLDLKYPHYQLNQIRMKYALRNKVAKKEYESPQFVYMRMAMALGETEPRETRMRDVKKWYEHFSHARLNAPTPNYVNLGTSLNGYASCCLYTTHDTAPSLAAGDHIAYMMTCASAGIGTHIKTRSIGDPVRGGMIAHQGKLPYYRSMVGAIGANLQNGRGGASTVYYTAYDPEVEVIQKLRHPMTPEAKRIAGCHYNFGSNKLFARKVARNEDYAPFSFLDQPDLYEAQYKADQSEFTRLYAEYEKTATVKLNARQIAINALTQAYETGVHYLHFTDTLNTHTPFKDTIYSSNLCLTGDTIVDIMLEDGSVIKTRFDSFVEQYSFGGFYNSKIKSYDVNTGEIVWKTVSAAAQTGVSEELYEIEDERGRIIKCTADHLIYTKNRGYVKACELVETDVLCAEI
jgi:ribonucleoside-diphosphate reductase alpha chain